jgi:hypothetical protein
VHIHILVRALVFVEAPFVQSPTPADYRTQKQKQAAFLIIFISNQNPAICELDFAVKQSKLNTAV